MHAAIVNYMYCSGWVYQSVDAVRSDLPRWERHASRAAGGAIDAFNR